MSRKKRKLRPQIPSIHASLHPGAHAFVATRDGSPTDSLRPAKMVWSNCIGKPGCGCPEMGKTHIVGRRLPVHGIASAKWRPGGRYGHRVHDEAGSNHWHYRTRWQLPGRMVAGQRL